MNSQQRNSSPESEHEPVTASARVLSTILRNRVHVQNTETMQRLRESREVSLLRRQEELVALMEEERRFRQNLEQQNTRLRHVLGRSQPRLERRAARISRQAAPEATPEHESD
jgi:hypothetical protein